MSNFQLLLILAGAVVLAAVIAYNAWDARRHAPRRPDAPPARADGDPPGDGLQRHEPILEFGDDEQPGAEAYAQGAGMGEAGAALAPDAAGDAAQGGAPAPPPAQPAAPVRGPLSVGERRMFVLDALIDAIAPLAADQPVSGEAALAAMPPTRRAGSKPFAIEGYNDALQQWETPQPGQRYRHLQAGVQLANRSGALNDIEFSEFVMKVQAFADAIAAAPDFPDMRAEVARARELDQFASDHDAQLSFVLRARQAAWSPGYVQQHAARLGFVPGSMPGRLVLPAGQGLPPLLSLSYDPQAAMSDEPEQTAVRDTTLSLDVAHVARAHEPFARLREVADALCRAMDGVLCDHSGVALPAMALDSIAADLQQLYDHLDARELAAGSPLARRLFS